MDKQPTTDTTPGAAGAAEAIRTHARGMVRWVEHIWEHGGKPTANDLASLSGSLAEIVDNLDALDAARRDAEARCGRMRRLAKAEIANSCTDPFNPDQCVRQEVQAAREDCSKHGDLDEEVTP